MCSRSGVGKVRHIQLRWLWIQDAVREKTVTLRKIKGTENCADMGTKALDGTTHQRLLKLLPLRPPSCKRLIEVAALSTEFGISEAFFWDKADHEQDTEPAKAITLLLAIITVLLSVILWLLSRSTATQTQTHDAENQTDIIDL
jgi:hypothetical protein